MTDAIPAVIETICETLGWDCGARWRWDPEGRVLRFTEKCPRPWLSARKAAQEQLQQLAHFDYLTGLPNRNLFNQLVAHALAKAKRRSSRLAILFIDLDGFKQVNDSFGHDAGDQRRSRNALANACAARTSSRVR